MNIKKRQEIINLMPWYNLGKLSSAEKLMVDKALNEDPSLREQLALDNKMMSTVLADPTLLDQSAFTSSSARLDKVLSQIGDTTTKAENATAKRQSSFTLLTDIQSFFSSLLSGSSHSFTYAVFAALTVVQVALLMFFVAPSVQNNSDFGVASGEPVQEINTLSMTTKDDASLVLLIAMKDNIQFEGFTSERFGELKLDILPDSYGYYRIRLNKHLNPEEIEALKHELSHNTANIVSVGKEIQPQ